MDHDPSTRVLVLPKYKRRNVSATRHFPPGCGRNLGPVVDLKFKKIPQSEKTLANGTAICDKKEKSSSNEISVNSQLEDGIEASDSIVKAVPLSIDISDSLMENEGKSDSKKSSSNCLEVSDSIAKAVPLSIDISDSLMENEGKSYSKESSSICFEASDNIVEAIHMEENGLPEIDILDSLVEKVVDLSGIVTEVNETPKGQDEEGIPKNNMQETESVANEVVHSHDREAYLSKVKYKRRSVSAKRRFPPFCGRNAPCPNNGNLQKTEVSNVNVKETTELKVIAKSSFEEIVEVLEENAKTENSSVNETLKSASNVSKLKTTDKKTFIQDVTTRESRHDLSKSKSTVPTRPAKERDSDPSKGNLGKQKSEEELPLLLKYKVANDYDKEVPDVGTWNREKVVSKKPNDCIISMPIVDNTPEYDHEECDKTVVYGLMAAPNCPWRKQASFITSKVSSCDAKRTLSSAKKASSRDARQTQTGCSSAGSSTQKSKKKKSTSETLPTFIPIVSNQGDARNKVRETLRLFQAITRKLLQEEEAKPENCRNGKRVDLVAAETVKERKKDTNRDIHYVGSVPGIEVGDEFQYRVELALVGVHRLYQGGIDYTKRGGQIIATSIVSSGVYADCLDNPDVLIYSGQGGLSGNNKEPQDQKLERGNLALFNSISEKNEVRVIHGTKSSNSDMKSKVITTYTYDGLYQVEKYWQEVGPHDKLVYKFELKRLAGQPLVAWKEVKQIKKFKVREGLLIDDISLGKEPFPICAVNTINKEKPPSFDYITELRYPNSYNPIPQKGCDCKDGCDSGNCLCVVKNGGEIPYNYNGAIVETKDLVYECGPNCKCPSSCPNRVSQFGLKIQLEIFKTPTRGWGVRSLNSIPSGSFICEYIGEVFEDKEAEKKHNDEYLFDIGHNYTYFFNRDEIDTTKKLPDVSEAKEDGGYTIDAAKFGNVGRFINHSCSPNLYAQNVLYDHEDRRMPHIMLFAAENIPPLKELTYHYNYSVDSVHDSSGNIKRKSCYCGSLECSGRMY